MENWWNEKSVIQSVWNCCSEQKYFKPLVGSFKLKVIPEKKKSVIKIYCFNSSNREGIHHISSKNKLTQTHRVPMSPIQSPTHTNIHTVSPTHTIIHTMSPTHTNIHTVNPLHTNIHTVSPTHTNIHTMKNSSEQTHMADIHRNTYTHKPTAAHTHIEALLEKHSLHWKRNCSEQKDMHENTLTHTHTHTCTHIRWGLHKDVWGRDGGAGF